MADARRGGDHLHSELEDRGLFAGDLAERPVDGVRDARLNNVRGFHKLGVQTWGTTREAAAAPAPEQELTQEPALAGAEDHRRRPVSPTDVPGSPRVAVHRGAGGQPVKPCRAAWAMTSSA